MRKSGPREVQSLAHRSWLPSRGYPQKPEAAPLLLGASRPAPQGRESESQAKAGRLPNKASPCLLQPPAAAGGVRGRSRGQQGSCFRVMGEGQTLSGSLVGAQPCPSVWRRQGLAAIPEARWLPPNVVAVKSPQPQSSCDTWAQASLLKASAPLGPGCHEAFQKMQTPGQGRAWGPRRNFPAQMLVAQQARSLPASAVSQGPADLPDRRVLQGQGTEVQGSPASEHSALAAQGTSDTSLQTAAATPVPLLGPDVLLPPLPTRDEAPQQANTNRLRAGGSLSQGRSRN